MLGMQRFLDPPGTGGGGGGVVDAVETGPLDDGYQLQVEGCRWGDAEPDPEITAAVRFVGDAAAGPGEDDAFEFSSDVRAAWRLDRAANRILPQSKPGLVCQSIGD